MDKQFPGDLNRLLEAQDNGQAYFHIVRRCHSGNQYEREHSCSGAEWGHWVCQCHAVDPKAAAHYVQRWREAHYVVADPVLATTCEEAVAQVEGEEVSK